MTAYTSLRDIRITKSLLGWGILAGPVYVATGAVEMATRPGFDPLRHALSLMSNGAFGWVHVSMLILTGLFTIAGAVGFHRSRYLGIGGGWAPWLLGLYGLGLVGAGVFAPDPALGFPPGTPADANAVSWRGLMHFICGAIGFAGLIGACFSFTRTFRRMGEMGWALFSAMTGVVFLVAFAGIASGGGSAMTIVAFTVAIVLAWAWITMVSLKTYRLHGNACPPQEASTPA
jgi:hypothetical protein